MAAGGSIERRPVNGGPAGAVCPKFVGFIGCRKCRRGRERSEQVVRPTMVSREDGGNPRCVMASSVAGNVTMAEVMGAVRGPEADCWRGRAKARGLSGLPRLLEVRFEVRVPPSHWSSAVVGTDCADMFPAGKGQSPKTEGRRPSAECVDRQTIGLVSRSGKNQLLAYR